MKFIKINFQGQGQIFLYSLEKSSDVKIVTKIDQQFIDFNKDFFNKQSFVLLFWNLEMIDNSPFIISKIEEIYNDLIITQGGDKAIKWYSETSEAPNFIDNYHLIIKDKKIVKSTLPNKTERNDEIKFGFQNESVANQQGLVGKKISFSNVNELIFIETGSTFYFNNLESKITTLNIPLRNEGFVELEIRGENLSPTILFYDNDNHTIIDEHLFNNLQNKKENFVFYSGLFPIKLFENTEQKNRKNISLSNSKSLSLLPINNKDISLNLLNQYGKLASCKLQESELEFWISKYDKGNPNDFEWIINIFGDLKLNSDSNIIQLGELGNERLKFKDNLLGLKLSNKYLLLSDLKSLAQIDPFANIVSVVIDAAEKRDIDGNIVREAVQIRFDNTTDNLYTEGNTNDNPPTTIAPLRLDILSFDDPIFIANELPFFPCLDGKISIQTILIQHLLKEKRKSLFIYNMNKEIEKTSIVGRKYFNKSSNKSPQNFNQVISLIEPKNEVSREGRKNNKDEFKFVRKSITESRNFFHKLFEEQVFFACILNGDVIKNFPQKEPNEYITFNFDIEGINIKDSEIKPLKYPSLFYKQNNISLCNLEGSQDNWTFLNNNQFTFLNNDLKQFLLGTKVDSTVKENPNWNGLILLNTPISDSQTEGNIFTPIINLIKKDNKNQNPSLDYLIYTFRALNFNSNEELSFNQISIDASLNYHQYTDSAYTKLKQEIFDDLAKQTNIFKVSKFLLTIKNSKIISSELEIYLKINTLFGLGIKSKGIKIIKADGTVETVENLYKLSATNFHFSDKNELEFKVEGETSILFNVNHIFGGIEISNIRLGYNNNILSFALDGDLSLDSSNDIVKNVIEKLKIANIKFDVDINSKLNFSLKDALLKEILNTSDKLLEKFDFKIIDFYTSNLSNKNTPIENSYTSITPIDDTKDYFAIKLEINLLKILPVDSNGPLKFNLLIVFNSTEIGVYYNFDENQSVTLRNKISLFGFLNIFFEELKLDFKNEIKEISITKATFNILGRNINDNNKLSAKFILNGDKQPGWDFRLNDGDPNLIRLSNSLEITNENDFQKQKSIKSVIGYLEKLQANIVKQELAVYSTDLFKNSDLKVMLVHYTNKISGIRVESRSTDTFFIEAFYKKVNDNIGVFSGNLLLPKELRTLKLDNSGYLEFPEIGLAVDTDGGWLVDVGFPWNFDFSRSGKIYLPPFFGWFGMYVQKSSFVNIENSVKVLNPC